TRLNLGLGALAGFLRPGRFGLDAGALILGIARPGDIPCHLLFALMRTRKIHPEGTDAPQGQRAAVTASISASDRLRAAPRVEVRLLRSSMTVISRNGSPSVPLTTSGCPAPREP